MDEKSAFLYGKIKEEVYVCQPPGFEDPDFPDRVYKVEKALYGLHQAPRSWYETLSTYLLDNEFQRGKIDKTLFIKRLQVQQKKDGIFISQDKHVEEILKKFMFTKAKIASTPIETQKPLLKDKNGEEVDVHMYRSMIGSLMYLTSSRPDIIFAMYACARYQVNPKVSHLHAVKRIFRYLKGQPKLGLWYLKDSLFDLVAYTDSDYTGASLDRKSTTGGCQFLRCRLISWQCKKQTVVANSITEAEYVAVLSCCGQVLWIQNQLLDYGNMRRVGKGFSGKETPLFQTMMAQDQEEVGEGLEMPTDPHHTPTIIQPSTSQPQKKQRSRWSKRKDIEVPQPSGPITNVANKAVNEEMDASLEKGCHYCYWLRSRAGQWSKNVSKLSNDPLLARRNTLRNGDDRLKLEELMALCTTLQSRVLALETTKTTQATEIASLKKRGRIADIDANKDIYLVNVHTDEDMFGVNDLDGDEVIVDNVDVVKTAKETRSVVEEVTAVIEKAKLVSAAEETVNAAATTVCTASTIPVSAATTTTTTTTIVSYVEITLAQALAELKSAKPKADKEKGKGIMIEEPVVEQVKPMKRLEQIRLDEELAFKLQAEEEEEEEERLAREKAQQIKEANLAWDDVQAKIEADYQLAQRLQDQEQEELIDEEKTTNKSLTKEYHVYLSEKHGRMEAQKTELVKESSKKAETELEKNKKAEAEVMEAELQSLIEIVPDEVEVAIDAIPLATKPPTIVDWKIHKEGKSNYYQIIRANGSSKMYMVFSQMLKSFDRQDLEDL
ncbi:uncharacterized mitochondrial protein-like protein [Tanacetum coccineum]